ncbi:MAG: hypothetical protein JWP36_1801 [Paucimonas sp.]|nr:hypothetical protein [Paucimonas sp.]
MREVGARHPVPHRLGDVVLKEASKEAVNFIIVGSTHLKTLWERFKGLKAIFMLPLRIVEDDPSDTLPSMPRDEL